MTLRIFLFFYYVSFPLTLPSPSSLPPTLHPTSLPLSLSPHVPSFLFSHLISFHIRQLHVTIYIDYIIIFFKHANIQTYKYGIILGDYMFISSDASDGSGQVEVIVQRKDSEEGMCRFVFVCCVCVCLCVLLFCVCMCVLCVYVCVCIYIHVYAYACICICMLNVIVQRTESKGGMYVQTCISRKEAICICVRMYTK